MLEYLVNLFADEIVIFLFKSQTLGYTILEISSINDITKELESFFEIFDIFFFFMKNKNSIKTM